MYYHFIVPEGGVRIKISAICLDRIHVANYRFIQLSNQSSHYLSAGEHCTLLSYVPRLRGCSESLQTVLAYTQKIGHPTVGEVINLTVL